jgi:hypothetical protein
MFEFDLRSYLTQNGFVESTPEPGYEKIGVYTDSPQ